jgi:hypothetical protein
LETKKNLRSVSEYALPVKNKFMSYYIYDKQEEPIGPYSLDELLKMRRTGSISSEAFYRQEDYEEWLPLQSLLKNESEKRNRKRIVLTVSAAALAIPIIALLSSSNKSTPPSNEAMVFVDGLAVVPVAIDKSALDDLIGYVRDGDNLSEESLLNSTRAFRVANGTKIRLLQTGLTSSQVEILEGSHKGDIVYIYSEWVKFGIPSSEYTSLRAVGAINQLPLAPTQADADNYEMEYNVYDIPERVKDADSFQTAPFRATVKILEKGISSSKIEVQETSDKSVGWVPNDWLENSDQPIKRRESEADKMAKQEADKFLGLSATELQEKLGTPIKIVPLSDANGSDLEQIIFDETPGQETFFLLEGNGAEVIDGEYFGIKLTPKYR